MLNSLERRGLLGVGAATLGMLGLRPVVTEGKKKRKKKRKKSRGPEGGCQGCFRNLGVGEEVIFPVADGEEDEGISLCPAGSRAVSGTLFLGNSNCVVTAFTALDASFTGWKLAIRCPMGQDSEFNVVIAICIS
ncbi:MAG: hypothetical protein ACRDJC_15160 [Thermomicrobiales bacterium]